VGRLLGEEEKVTKESFFLNFVQKQILVMAYKDFTLEIKSN
jgi:hypothetical protein